MKPEHMAEALEGAAKELGVRVRYEALAPGSTNQGGGLCRVRDEWWVIIDKKMSASERTSILAEALSTMDTDAIQLPPKVREILQMRRAARRAQ